MIYHNDSPFDEVVSGPYIGSSCTRDIKAFPACIEDSDCARVTGSEGEVADFKCFQSMCFPWADKRLQRGQVHACSKAVDLTSHSTIIVLTWSTG